MTSKTKELVTIEIDDSLIEGISEVPGAGVCMLLKGGIDLFLSHGRVGIFLQSTIEDSGRDFSKIETTELALLSHQFLDLEDFPDVSTSIQ